MMIVEVMWVIRYLNYDIQTKINIRLEVILQTTINEQEIPTKSLIKILPINKILAMNLPTTKIDTYCVARV